MFRSQGLALPVKRQLARGVAGLGKTACQRFPAPRDLVYQALGKYKPLFLLRVATVLPGQSPQTLQNRGCYANVNFSKATGVRTQWFKFPLLIFLIQSTYYINFLE